MTGTTLKDHLKKSTGTENFDNILDSDYYFWLSRSHENIAEKVKSKVDSKSFMGISQAAIVAGQYLYDNLGEESDNGKFINVIDAVYVKYNGASEDATKLDLLDFTEMPESREYYLENQSPDNPFCTITGRKILIFPKPTISVSELEGGMEIVGSRNVLDITEDSTADDIFNGALREYHELVVQGAKQYVYEYLQEFSKKQDAKLDYERDLARMIAEISYRGSQPVAYEEDAGEINKLLNC